MKYKKIFFKLLLTHSIIGIYPIMLLLFGFSTSLLNNFPNVFFLISLLIIPIMISISGIPIFIKLLNGHNKELFIFTFVITLMNFLILCGYIYFLYSVIYFNND